jgi:hypothetical protein
MKGFRDCDKCTYQYSWVIRNLRWLLWLFRLLFDLDVLHIRPFEFNVGKLLGGRGNVVCDWAVFGAE